MNNHEYLHEWISRYNDGDLKGEELEQFLQILSSDPEVRSETNLDRELTEFLQDSDLLEFRELLDQARCKKRRGFGLNCLLLAALMIVLVALSGFWIYLDPVKRGHPFLPGEEAIESATQKSPSQNKQALPLRRNPGFYAFQTRESKPGQDLLAANFEPLIYMEGMVGIVTRAGDFGLLSPGKIVTIVPGDTLRFHWSDDGKTSLSFEVINNRGDNMISREGVSGVSLTLLTISWKEGLYYWKFLDNDNLVSVGKILIKR